MNKASNRAAQARSLAGDDNFRVFYRHEYERAVRLAWLLTGSQPVAWTWCRTRWLPSTGPLDASSRLAHTCSER